MRCFASRAAVEGSPKDLTGEPWRKSAASMMIGTRSLGESGEVVTATMSLEPWARSIDSGSAGFRWHPLSDRRFPRRGDGGA